MSLLDDLPPLSFDFIMADPPWQFANFSPKGIGKGAASKYECMGLDAIKTLPVSQLAAPDSLLMLWATNPLLDKAFDVMRSWGFTFKTAGHWAKYTASGKQAFGTGYLLRAAGEPFLIGVIGRPKVTRSSRSVINGIVRGHSRKPIEAYEWAEKLMPNARYLELFARQSRPGWTTWGNEATKFDPCASTDTSKSTSNSLSGQAASPICRSDGRTVNGPSLGNSIVEIAPCA